MKARNSFLFPYISIVSLLYLYRISIVFLCISTVSLLYLLYFFFNSAQVSGISTKSASVNMDISIGQYRFSLWGFSSPHALVTFSGMGIFDQTYADESGFFQFKNRFSPFSPREGCLTTRDQLGRLTLPVCLPPFPTKYDVTIGPVVMPPTLSLDKNDYWVGDEVILTGQTIPNTDVNLSLFTKEKDFRRREEYGFEPMSRVATNYREETEPTSLMHLREDAFEHLIRFSNFVKEVEAFSFPELQTKSDEKGNFSISLPSSSAKSYRLFTQVKYQEKTSPNSLTLSLKILPVWMMIIKILFFLWTAIKSRLIELFIAAELIALVLFFLRRYFHPATVAKSKALTLRKDFSIEKLIKR